ncbi:MAG: ABC transporter permease subunit, partial [Acidimicrobiia bacterium]
MREYLPFLVIGLTSGSIYAIAAMGLVVTYKTSGVFNFAHGAVGMFATFIFHELRTAQSWPTPLAFAAAVFVVAPVLGVLIDRMLLSRLGGSSAATYVVVSLGLLVALQSTAVAIFGGETRQVAPLFPT